MKMVTDKSAIVVKQLRIALVSLLINHNLNNKEKQRVTQ